MPRADTHLKWVWKTPEQPRIEQSVRSQLTLVLLAVAESPGDGEGREGVGDAVSWGLAAAAFHP